MLFTKLVGHYPHLGGDPDDPAAQSRAADWLDYLGRLNAPAAYDAITTLIESPDAPRFPGISDMQAIMRQRIAQAQLEVGTYHRHPEPFPTEDEYLGGLAACRAKLAER